MNEALSIPGGISILISGENSINGTTGIQVMSDGNLNIKAAADTDSLDFDTLTEAIVYKSGIEGNISIDSGIYNAVSHGFVDINTGTLTIGGNTVIESDNSDHFISSKGNIAIKDNAQITANSVINTSNGNVELKDNADVKIVKKENGNTPDMGIHSGKGDISIIGKAKFTAATNRSGLSLFAGNLLIDEGAVVDVSSNNTDSGATINFSATPTAFNNPTMTVKGSLSVSSKRAGIGMSRPNSSVILDGASLSVTSDYIAVILTQANGSFMANNSTIEINNAETSEHTANIGIYLAGTNNNSFELNSSSLTLKNAVAGIAVINGSPKLTNSNVEISAVAIGDTHYASLTKPTLIYDSCRKVTSGTSAADAKPLSSSDIESTSYNRNLYFKIEPVSEHTFDENGNCIYCGRIATTYDTQAPNVMYGEIPEELNDIAYYGTAKGVDGHEFGLDFTADGKTVKATWNNVTGGSDISFGVIVRNALDNGVNRFDSVKFHNAKQN